MPMIRSLASVPSLPRRAAHLAGALALALAAGLAPTLAQAQFSGNANNDLTQAGNTGDNNSSSSSSSSNNNSSNSGGGDAGGGAAAAAQGTGAAIQLNQSDTGLYYATRRPAQPEPGSLSDRPEPYAPGEFEQYVQRRARPNADRPIRRFGANLLTDPSFSSAAQDPLPSVPGDYIVRPGDEISVSTWGTVNSNLHLIVDRAGNIAVPRVGAVAVAGLKHSELAPAISRRVSQVFKNFQISATLGQVRAIRVFVGGYAQRPGSTTVNGLASVLHALMRAGGPSAAGSFRDIHLRRGGKEIAVFDLYDLLLKGDHDADQLVQPDDVIFIGPVGTQVAVLGSVNEPAIFELKPGEKLEDLLRMAGGFNAVADRDRVAIERLADRATGHITQLDLPAHAGDSLGTGDVVRVFSVVTASLPSGHQNQTVHIDGEVAKPGDYILPPGSRIADALRAAGGLTGAAYPFGTELTRESVRQTQQINYERALRDLETDMSKNQATQRATSSEEIAAQSASAASNARLLERLRAVKPTGRIVLQLPPDAAALPDLPLEDGDSIKIPPRGTSVGVFGSVFNTGSFVFESGHTTEQYLALAGGSTRGADKGSIFMVRANGSVISARQGASFWHDSTTFRDAVVQPGDTIFVPEELNKSTFVQDAKDWTQILYQFGLGLAGIKSLGL